MDEHVLQFAPNYCVPACIVMMEIWRGEVPTNRDERQTVLFQTYNVFGSCALPNLHGTVGRYEKFPVLDPDAIADFAARIDEDSRAIATCLSGPLGRWSRRRRIDSPHGSLPSTPAPYHAVCVVAHQERSFHVLDPWTANRHQPLVLSFRDFGEIWTGEVLLCAREV